MSATPGRAPDIVLEPGQFWFGSGDLRIGTLLGSCVAITLWNPLTRVGGMCHYLLPTRVQTDLPDGPAGRGLDGRYGDEALELFLNAIEEAGNSPHDYQAKVFGGGNQFPEHVSTGRLDVPTRNVDAGLQLLAGHDLQVTAKHVGGSGARQVILDLADGHVWVRHRRLVPAPRPEPGTGKDR